MGKKEKKKDIPELGKEYGKPDLERLGLFVEMPYMNGKKYVSPFPKNTAIKGLNMLTSSTKSKNATQAGYFEDEFKRIFIKEAIKGRGRKPPKPRFKNVSTKPFTPTGPAKWHACPGDYYGTFEGKVEYFSNKRRRPPKYKKESKNFITNPGKKGGPGYPHICMSKYPEHLDDPSYGAVLKAKQYGKNKGGPWKLMHHPRPYFQPNPYRDEKLPKDAPIQSTFVKPKEKVYKVIGTGKFVPTGPAKWQGGYHAGCFDKFPAHMPEKYNPPPPKPKKGDENVFYIQSMGMKTLFTRSILNRNVDFRLHQQNYANFKPAYVKHLI